MHGSWFGLCSLCALSLCVFLHCVPSLFCVLLHCSPSASAESNGQIDKKIFRNGCRAVCISHSPYFLNRLFDLFDELGTGSVDYRCDPASLLELPCSARHIPVPDLNGCPMNT